MNVYVLVCGSVFCKRVQSLINCQHVVLTPRVYPPPAGWRYDMALFPPFAFTTPYHTHPTQQHNAIIRCMLHARANAHGLGLWREKLYGVENIRAIRQPEGYNLIVIIINHIIGVTAAHHMRWWV